MDFDSLCLLFLVIGIATYFQTVTGFGLGMIVMGATSGFKLAPMDLVAAVVSLISLASSAVALRGCLHLIDWRAIRAVLIGVLPSIIAGVMLLEYLSETASMLLQFLLGSTITYSGIIFAVRPTQLSERSSDRGFFFSGLLSGLSGGLFGLAGPPVIFLFYRQPMAAQAIRSMLLLVFASTSLTRSIFVATQGGLTREVWGLATAAALLAVPVAFLAKRYPPPLSPVGINRLAYSVLVLIGISLIFSAIF